MRKCGVLLAVLVSLLFASSVGAEVKFDYGASLRLRQEIWDNVVNLNIPTVPRPDRNFFRLRTSVWGKADFTKDFGAYLRLTNEAKYYIGPFKPNQPRNDDRLDEDELIIDNLYVDVLNAFGLPVDMRIGRQDFLGPNSYGEGFLILDGTPADGSRTFYFNAAKLVWRITKTNSIDFVYLNNGATDTYLPSLYPAHKGALYIDHKKLLNASDEQGYVVYSRNKIGDGLTIEPYYIYKSEDDIGAVPSLHLNTLGARAVYAFKNGWKVGAEYAHQFGESSSGVDRRGDGGYVFVGAFFKEVPLKPEFDLRYVFLSGDDPDSTNTNETWNPLFSRAPYWNELLIYSFPFETAGFGGGIPGYWTNMHIYKASVKLNLSPETALNLAYQYLRADEERVTSISDADSKDRGHLPTAILTHKFSKKVDGMLQFEYFSPGDYYRDTAEEAIFFRWQLQVRI